MLSFLKSVFGPSRAARPEGDADRLRSAVADVGFWWHSIDLGHGVVTPGHKTPEIHRHELDGLGLPDDLSGKTVLDVGAWDGFYSFECERRGARRVVALDHFVWSLDLARTHGRGADDGFPRPTLAEAWDPVRLPGKRGFDTAHRLLGSKVEAVVGDFMSMDLAPLGTFDVVLFLGVLYHMRHPLLSLERLARLTRELAVIETEAIVFPGRQHLALCEFYETNECCGDPTNWWAPNDKALEGMLRAAGFARVEVRRKAPPLPDPPPAEPLHYRAIAHARK
jgi:tRNA (mo5U34)-methyltransferase